MLKLLSKFVDAVFFATIFFVIITPLAIITNILGRDKLQIRSHKNGKASHWQSADHKVKFNSQY